MSSIKELLNQALRIMENEIVMAEDYEDAWLELILDVIEFGNKVGDMADFYEIGTKKDDKKLSPDIIIDRALKNLFKPKSEDDQ